jgi:para-nitrobenzyl esterase
LKVRQALRGKMTTFQLDQIERIPRSSQVVVETASGAVRGVMADGVNTFKGVPYAAPPFGPNRMRPPKAVEPWSGIRNALTSGPMPPQLPYPPPWDALIPERATVGEDCLNLNIWTPHLGAARLPVMVWIPGGMFEAGSAATYEGGRFARDGVVCLTINYRVGAEGFLYLPDGNANRGLLDQVAALEWVRDNIAAFGGDPGNVTIFGESSGAMSVGTLLSMPRAAGLFRRAIAQSGGAHQVMQPQAALQVAERLAERLGIEATREAFSAIPIDRLLQQQAELKADLMTHPERWNPELAITMLPWQPVVDGEIIPARPLERIAAGAGAEIELMTGSNLDESNFFLVPTGAIDHITNEALAAAIAAYGLPLDTTLATYGAIHSGATPGELLSVIQADWLFRIPALRLADAHATGRTGTYMYEFAWRSPQFGGRLGACHGGEIAFVFDTLGLETEALAGPNPPQSLADTMHAAWVGFAARGDPGWPSYDLTRRATMRFNTRSEVVNDPRSSERALWQGIR